MAAVIALAIVVRFTALDLRTFHGDEAVNAVKFEQLRHGEYRYDSNEFHGPVLPYATAPASWLVGGMDYAAVDEAFFRRVTAAFGVALVVLTLLSGPLIGRGAALGAGLLAAISPAMSFYSRYYIHEMPLVVFTFAGLLAVWKHIHAVHHAEIVGGEGRGRGNPDDSGTHHRAWGGWISSRTWSRPHPARGLATLSQGERGWAAVAGVCAGLMHATKETFVFPLGAAGAGLAVVAAWREREHYYSLRKHLHPGPIVAATVCAVAVSVLFFSQFFTNAAGPLDSLRTYFFWTVRGAGVESPHVHPWYWYLQILIYSKLAAGPWWSEGLIVALAVVGGVMGASGRGVAAAHRPAVRFLLVYTVVLAAIYAVVPYKTPWCMLGFLHGMILLAGVGAAGILRIRKEQTPTIRGLIIGLGVLLLAATVQLGAQCYRTNFDPVFAVDRRNPYIYAQAGPQTRRIVQRIDEIAAVSGEGAAMRVHVFISESEWPLPFYLRRHEKVGYWKEVPDRPRAPVMIADEAAELKLAGLLKEGEYQVEHFGLRPDVVVGVYVRADLWEKFLERK
jgi:predicted membrane-bound mannosyltransferase